MILIDTSGWIEYLNDTGHEVIRDIDYALDYELVCLGDLIYCEGTSIYDQSVSQYERLLTL